MKVSVTDLLHMKQNIIPNIARKFHITERQAENFLRIAIEAEAKSRRLELKNGEISGSEDVISSLIQEIENWSEEEFDEEDFEIIGYCRSINEE